MIFPQAFKERMVEAGIKDTVMVMKPFRASSRVLKNKDAQEILRIEREKGSNVKFADIGKLAKFERLREGMNSNDPDLGIWNCGQVRKQ